MNSVIIIGNLTRDPDLRYTTGANQTAMARFTVAVNDGYGEKRRTSFIPVVVFGKQAENCDRYLSKGRKVAVNGRIQTGSYEKDGRTVYTTDVVASSVEFLPSGGQQGDGAYDSGRYRQRERAVPERQQDKDVPSGFTALDDTLDDDIPF